MVAHSSWPEISRAFGEGNKQLVKKMFLYGLLISTAMLFLYFSIIWSIGPVIFKYWTKGQLDFDYTIFLILTISAVAGSLWYQSYILLSSINRHLNFSFVIVGTGIILLCCCFYLQENGSNIINTLILLPIAELFLAFISLYIVTKMFKSK
jgi:Na+-driven multidrug efflux pump